MRVLFDDARHGALRCAVVDRVTGASWVGTDRGALVAMPGEPRWRHLKLDGLPVLACAAGARGVWLAGPEHLFAPDPRGSGVARHRLVDAVGERATVAGMASDRGGLWLALRGADKPVPSLLRLPHRPPVFQRFHARLARHPGAISAIGGDGERAWALGPGWVTELEERSVVRPSATEDGRPVAEPQCDFPAASDPEEQIVEALIALSPLRWLRVHPQGLVGRNEDGLFCASHGNGALLCPRLPGRVDALATDWLGVPGGMLVGTAQGAYFVDGAGSLRSVVPDEDVVALIAGPAITVVTSQRVLSVPHADLAAAPLATVDLRLAGVALARSHGRSQSVAARRAAARMLALCGDARDLEIVRPLIADQDVHVRIVACEVVGRIAPDLAPSLLAPLMADPCTLVQAAATRAMHVRSAA